MFVVAAAAGAEVGKAISNSYPKTDGSSALQRPKEPFKPELKLYKGNKKNPLSFISPVPKTDKTKKQAVFTVNPYDFNPKGLIRNVYVQPGTGKNGGIIKWEMPETRVAIFEWDEDYKYGSHYHVMKIEQSNQHFGLHYYPGDLVPEPWNTTYF